MQTPTPDAAVIPPDAPTVMYFTYQVDGDGATSYEVQNGSVATFWASGRRRATATLVALRRSSACSS